jgi:hypothetical protein
MSARVALPVLQPRAKAVWRSTRKTLLTLSLASAVTASETRSPLSP